MFKEVRCLLLKKKQSKYYITAKYAVVGDDCVIQVNNTSCTDPEDPIWQNVSQGKAETRQEIPRFHERRNNLGQTGFRAKQPETFNMPTCGQITQSKQRQPAQTPFIHKYLSVLIRGDGESP